MSRRIVVLSLVGIGAVAALLRGPVQKTPPGKQVQTAAAVPDSAPAVPAAAAPAAMTPERAAEILELPSFVAPEEIRDTGETLAYAPHARSQEICFDEHSSTVRVGDLAMTSLYGAFSPARREGGRVIYERSDAALIYAPSATGVKEDLVLYRNPGTSDFAWRLDLPVSMEARLLDDGSIGIYSPGMDPGQGVRVRDGESAQAIEEARANPAKERLDSRLPATNVIDAGLRGVPSRFSLSAGVVVVHAGNLDSLEYPVTIDPSITITLAADFLTDGNNEGAVTYINTPDAIQRLKMGGGNMGTWLTDDSFTTGRSDHASVAYNGFLYVMGGTTNGVDFLQDIQVAPIDSASGTILAFNGALANTLPVGLKLFGAAAYNGYMYIIGGESAGALRNEVWYARIASNGAILTPWNTNATTIGTARRSFATAVHRGFIYIMAGEYSDVSFPTDVKVASINADGTVGAWSVTSVIGTFRRGAAVAFEDYLYHTGGKDGSGNDLTTCRSVRILPSGLLSGWVTTEAMTVARSGHAVAPLRGYVVVAGGSGGTNTVELASMGSGGKLGPWRRDPRNLTSSRSGAGYAWHQDRFYVTGGSFSSTVYDASAAEAGGITGLTSTNANLIFRHGHSAVAWNGNLYLLGGYDNSAATSCTTSVRYGAISPGAGVSGWVNGTAVPTYDFGIFGVSTGTALMGCAAYNGYMYMTGGATDHFLAPAISNVYYATIDPVTGALGAWTPTTALPAARRAHGCFVAHGRLYCVGGDAAGAPGAAYQNAVWAPIAANGTLGAWTTDTATTTLYTRAAVELNGNAFYMVGGQTTADTSGVAQTAVVRGAITVSSGNITWAALTALPAARTSAMSFVANEQLYVVGGRASPTGTPVSGMYVTKIRDGDTVDGWVSDTTYSQLETGGRLTYYSGVVYDTCGVETGSEFIQWSTEMFRVNSNGTVGAWTTETSLTAAKYFGASAGWGDFLYFTGGNSSTADVWRIAITGEGRTTGAWTADTDFPTARYAHQVVGYKGRLYVTGGVPSYNEVRSAAPDPTSGVLGSWNATTGLPGGGRYYHDMVIYNDYIYVVGGRDGGTGVTSNLVYYAPITDTVNGTVGAWNPTSSMLNPRDLSTATAHNGYLYALGGYDTTTALGTHYVEAATINVNGTLGGWARTTSLPFPLYGHQAHAQDGFIYSVGGYSSVGGNKEVVLRASLGSGGDIGAWSETAPLPAAERYIGFTAHRGHLYTVGGYVAGAVASVYQTPLLTPSAVAFWSHWNDLGGTKILHRVTVSGNAAAKGKVLIGVRGATGSTWSNVVTDTQVTLGVPVNFTPGTQARYVHILAKLDDTLSAPVGVDSAGVMPRRDVTDVVLDYNTPPGAPSGLAQFESVALGGGSILPGAGANSTEVQLSATVTDVDAGQQVRLRVQYAVVGSNTFTDAPSPGNYVASGATSTVTIPLGTLVAGTRYHWRCYAEDNYALATAIGATTSFGSSSSAQTDFYVDQAPVAPVMTTPNGGQFQADGTTYVPDNTDSDSKTIVFKSVPVSDPDTTLNTLTYQVEVRPVASPFTSPTVAGYAAAKLAEPTVFFDVTGLPSGFTASISVSNILLVGTNYQWQARVVDNEGLPNAGGTNGWIQFEDAGAEIKDFGLTNNDPPDPPDVASAGLGQLNLDNSPIVVDGETNLANRAIQIKAVVTDPQSDLVKIQVEIRPISQDFGASPPVTGYPVDQLIFFETAFAPAGSTFTVNPAPLIPPAPAGSYVDGGYHWRIRGVDDRIIDTASAWVYFGGNSDGAPPGTPADPDFRVDQTPDAPDFPPLSLNQFQSDGTTAIGQGAGASGVFFKGQFSDPNVINPDGTPSGQVRLQIEVRPVADLFTDPTVGGFAAAMGAEPAVFYESVSVVGDGTVTLSLPATVFLGGGQPMGTSFKWQARVVDSDDLPWTSAGTNNWEPFGVGDPDFVIVSNNAPDDPVLQQYLSDGITPISEGFTISDPAPKLKGTLADTLNQQSRMQLEIRAVGTPFSFDDATLAPFVPDGINLFETALAPNLTEHEVALPALADGLYYWQARAVDFENQAGSWTPFGGNATTAPDFRIETVNNAPSDPTGLSQLAPPENVPVVVGGTIIGRTGVLEAESRDPESDLLYIEFEVQPVGTPFTDAPTQVASLGSPGVAAAVTVTNLPLGGYHWQARAVDAALLPSNWVAFGSNPETEADFVIDATVAVTPNLPVQLQQWLPNNSSIIPLGDTINLTSVRFKATVAHPRGEAVQLEVELQQIGFAFTGTPTKSSPFVVSGTTADLTVLGQPGGYFRWQGRTVDSRGAASEWVSFGGNPETTPPDDPLTTDDESSPAISTEANDFVISAPSGNPYDPLITSQFRDNGTTPIPVGSPTSQGIVVFRAFISDPDGDAVRLGIVAKPLGVPFDDTLAGLSPLLPSGSEIAVAVSGLSDGPYKWRALALDSNNFVSAYVDFGNNTEFDADFVVAPVDNVAPFDPTGLDQVRLDGLTSIPVGEIVQKQGIIFHAFQDDPESDLVRMEVEARQVGATFAGVPTAVADQFPSGFPGEITQSGFASGTSWHWQVRSVDTTGKASNWAAFGGNADPGDVDFTATTMGVVQDDSKGCGSMGVDLLLPLGALAFCRRLLRRRRR